MSTSETPSEAGWYDDPDGRRDLQRYWNGETWSGAPRKRPPQLKWSGVLVMFVGGVVLTAVVWLVWIAL
ncbi:MAG: DUF2510 domain-containing protein [Actinomycetota bacterium]|nr:DUF2510 domain-containing protein [Actinomycetota bacterium]